MNKHFADDFVHFFTQIDLDKLTDNDPSFRPIREGDEILGDLPDSLKRLEAARRRFRDLLAKAKRKLHSFLGLHYGNVAKPEIILGFKQRYYEANDALEDFNLFHAFFSHALGRWAADKLDGRKGTLYVRRGWKVVFAEEEDEGVILTPEPSEEDSPLKHALTKDTAPLPEDMEPPPHEKDNSTKPTPGPESPTDPTDAADPPDENDSQDEQRDFE